MCEIRHEAVACLENLEGHVLIFTNLSVSSGQVGGGCSNHRSCIRFSQAMPPASGQQLHNGSTTWLRR